LLWQDSGAEEEIFVSLYLSAGFPEVNLGTCVAQPVLLDIRGDLDDLPIVQGEVPPEIVICLWLHIFVRFHECEFIFFSMSKHSGMTAYFIVVYMGKYVLTYVL